MSIRTKFFALAGVLLVLFGAVIGTLAILQAIMAHELDEIVNHHQPIRRLFADADADTFEYELRINRLLLRPPPEGELIAEAEQIGEIGNRIRATFGKLRLTVAEAITDNRNDPQSLHAFAAVQGALPFLDRDVEPFLVLGNQVIRTVLAGRPDDAKEQARGFARFQNTVAGPDVGVLRQKLATLTEKATRSIHETQQLNSWISFSLFLIAAVVGLTISGIGSSQVVHALRRLLASTKSLENGTPIPAAVLTKDEVGQLAVAFNRMIDELRTRERIKETFGKFLDPRIVTRLIGADAEPEAERKLVTIFFSDIKGFSGISERITAASMVKLLNGYFSAVAGEILRHNGIIDKYIGDSVMAFWCPPFSTGDEHAADACKAAMAQVRAIAEFRKLLPEITGLRRDAPDLIVRMGMATGEVVVGTIGSAASRAYTVIGDTVNLASRLEGVNKVYGTTILMTEDTLRFAQHAVTAREIDMVMVSGKSEAIRIYELLGVAGDSDLAVLAQTFGEGLVAYRKRQWEIAEQKFRECQQLAPNDGPSEVYLRRIEIFRTSAPPETWDAVWRMDGK
jgi:adenylate cyclase